MTGSAGQASEHAFVVPAYGEPEHLRECLESLMNQTVRSPVVVCTSTPSAGLNSICREFGLEPVVHSPNRGIAHDWNAALANAAARFVTVAHQDDVYYPEFAERTLQALAGAERPVLAFTDYEEFTELGVRPRSRLLLIKRVLLELGFLGRDQAISRFAKTNSLRFACPIPCPAVTLNTDVYREGFDDSYQINLDWATWIAASRCEGSFVWVREVLMGHRIHAMSETSAAITDGRRQAEDLRVMCSMWPAPIARLIVKTYGIAYASNQE